MKQQLLRTITSTGSIMSNLTVNSTVFNFSRISAHNSMPVMSRLVISPVSNGLDGTVVNCVDVDAAEVSSTTVIIGDRNSSLGRELAHLFMTLSNHTIVLSELLCPHLG